MARIHWCHVTSREAMLFMKYEHYGKCQGSFKDSQGKCKYNRMKIAVNCQHFIDVTRINKCLENFTGFFLKKKFRRCLIFDAV